MKRADFVEFKKSFSLIVYFIPIFYNVNIMMYQTSVH